MEYLLDTHTLLWWLDGDTRLSKKCIRLITDESHTIYVSAASAWEITTKFRLGKLPNAAEVAHDVTKCVSSQGFLSLPIELQHAERAGKLPGPHRDPFDRMLIAQAIFEDITILSNEEVFDQYKVARIWD